MWGHPDPPDLQTPEPTPRHPPQELKGTLARELDFENEGRNAERCARDLRHCTYVVVPRVHWDKCSKVGGSGQGDTPRGGDRAPGGDLGRVTLSCHCPQRVLTADFCEGCKITNVEGIRSQGLGVQDVRAGGGWGGPGNSGGSLWVSEGSGSP